MPPNCRRFPGPVLTAWHELAASIDADHLLLNNNANSLYMFETTGSEGALYFEQRISGWTALSPCQNTLIMALTGESAPSSQGLLASEGGASLNNGAHRAMQVSAHENVAFSEA